MFLEVEYSRELLPKGTSPLLIDVQLYDHVTYWTAFISVSSGLCFVFCPAYNPYFDFKTADLFSPVIPNSQMFLILNTI